MGDFAWGARLLRANCSKSLSTFALGEKILVGSGSGGIGLSELLAAWARGSGCWVAMVKDSNWRAFLFFFFLGLIQLRVFIDQR
jgi:hypothetical protein